MDDLRRRAEAEGLDLPSYLQRIAPWLTDKEPVPREVGPAPDRRSLDDVLIQALDRQSQMNMLRALGSNGSEEHGPKINAKEIADAIVSALGSAAKPPAGLGGLNFQAIVETSIAARLANQAISDTSRDRPVEKPVDEHVRTLEAQLIEQGHRLASMEMQRLDDERRLEHQLSEREMEELRLRLVEVDSRVAMLGSGRETPPKYAAPPERAPTYPSEFTESSDRRAEYPSRYTNPSRGKPIYQRYYPAARSTSSSLREGAPGGAPMPASPPSERHRPAHGDTSDSPSQTEGRSA